MSWLIDPNLFPLGSQEQDVIMWVGFIRFEKEKKKKKKKKKEKKDKERKRKIKKGKKELTQQQQQQKKKKKNVESGLENLHFGRLFDIYSQIL